MIMDIHGEQLGGEWGKGIMSLLDDIIRINQREAIFAAYCDTLAEIQENATDKETVERLTRRTDRFLERIRELTSPEEVEEMEQRIIAAINKHVP